MTARRRRDDVMKIEITIVTADESITLTHDRDFPAVRNAAGKYVWLGWAWERIRDDAQAWVDSRAGKETGQE